MKYIYSLLLFASFITGYAQSVNKAFQEYNDVGAHLVELNGNYYFVTNILTPVFQDEIYVSSVDAAGNLRFQTSIIQGESNVATRMIRTLDNKIALTGYGTACDSLTRTQKLLS